MILTLPETLRARLVAAVERTGDATMTPEQWAIDALTDCIRASEDAAGLGCCEGCEAVAPVGDMVLDAEDGCLLCKGCAS